jgi:hypothetical protein
MEMVSYDLVNKKEILPQEAEELDAAIPIAVGVGIAVAGAVAGQWIRESLFGTSEEAAGGSFPSTISGGSLLTTLGVIANIAPYAAVGLVTIKGLHMLVELAISFRKLLASDTKMSAQERQNTVKTKKLIDKAIVKTKKNLAKKKKAKEKKVKA